MLLFFMATSFLSGKWVLPGVEGSGGRAAWLPSPRQCLLFPRRLATTSLMVPTLSPLTKPASLLATSARSSSGRTMNRSTSQAFWSECRGDPQVAQAAWQPPAPCQHTGLSGCGCLWCDPSPPCITVPKSGGPHRLQGAPAPCPAPSGSPQDMQPALMGGTPAHRTGGLHPWHLHPTLSRAAPGAAFITAATSPTSFLLPKTPSPCPGRGLPKVLCSRRQTLASGSAANSWLGCLLADSRISCPRSTSSRKGSARSSWYVQGGC